MIKTAFRTAYEKSHDLLNDSLEILDKLYDEKDFETRRQLLTNLRNTMKQVNKNFNDLRWRRMDSRNRGEENAYQ